MILEPDTIVDHYKVLRRIGQGGSGHVFLARDLRLGRKVALKLLDAGAAERGGLEAQATARFNHPHIVTVHAVGEHDGRPYLALEYVEGETLRARLAGDRPGPREALRIGLAIAGALHEAHRHGVLHRDLKPENILLGKDGRLRVADFGLAQLVSDAPAEVSGTPAYMAPEQWRGGALTPATDVWALGLILHELVHGRRPDGESSTRQLAARAADPAPLSLAPTPGPLGELIARCLAKDERGRPTTHELLERLEAMLAERPRLGEEASPFRGLLGFTEQHADLFFGRSAEILEATERLREQPVLPVVGMSGAGKSSFVLAGVAPRLREQTAWTVISLRPGARPFPALARALLSADPRISGAALATASRARPRSAQPDREAQLAADLRDDATALARVLRLMAERAGEKVLLVVDQLEELATLGSAAAERHAFLLALCTAADDRQDPARVCFTVRDDFLGRLAEDCDRAEVRAVLGRVMVLRTPGPAALAEILTRPVELSGYRYEEPAIVDEMVAAVGGEQAGLPLLGFAARTLWERRDRERRLLTRAAHEAMGGVAGALAEHAEGILAGMSSAEVAAARALLLRLVTPERTRRVLLRAQLLEGLPAEAERVADRLVEARLLAARKGAGDAEVELAHESLILRWARVGHWIDESREELAFVAELEAAAQLWGRRGRPRDEVWVGDALIAARRRLERLTIEVPAIAADFIAAGESAERARRRRRRVLWAIAAGLLVAALVASVIIALTIADKERTARASLAESLREGARAALDRGDLAEARARLRLSLESEDALDARATWWRLVREPAWLRVKIGNDVAGLSYSPDGRTLAVADRDGGLHLVDPMSGADEVVRGFGEGLSAARFLGDGQRIVVGTDSGRLLVVRRGETPRVLPGVHPGGVRAIFASRDGARVVSVGRTSVVVWDGARLAPLARRELSRRLENAALSGDGQTLALVLEGAGVRVEGALDGRVRLERDGEWRGVALDGRGATLVASDASRQLTVFDVEHGTTGTLAGDAAGSWGLALTHDDRRVVSAGFDGSVVVFELASRRRVATFSGGVYPAGAVEISPDDGWLVCDQESAHARIFRLSSREPLPHAGHDRYGTVSVFSADGERFATGSEDKSIHLWDTESGRDLGALVGHEHTILAMVFSPDGSRLFSSDFAGTVHVWDTATRRTVKVLYEHAAPVGDVAVTPDGAWLLSAGGDGTVRLWRLPGVEPGPVFRPGEGGLWPLAVSPDGALAAAGNPRGRVYLFRVPSTAPAGALDTGGRDVVDLVFSPDGRELYASLAADDTEVRAFDLATGKGRVLARRPGRWSVRLALRPDGNLVLGGHRTDVIAPTGAVLQTSELPSDHRIWISRDGRTMLDGDHILSARDFRPRWGGRAILRSLGEVGSNDTWMRLAPGLPAIDVPPTAWRKAILETAVGVDESAGGRWLCMSEDERHFSLWDRDRDQRLGTFGLDERAVVPGLVAAEGACVAITLRDDVWRALVYRPEGPPEPLFEGATGLAHDGTGFLAAVGAEVLELDATLRVVARHPGVPGIGNLLRVGDRIAFTTGYQTGGSLAAGEAPRLNLKDLPTRDVNALAAGPSGTLVVAMQDGNVGLWSLESGMRVGGFKLAGPATHAAYVGGVLYVLSERNERVAVDLSVFERPYCEVLAEVWREVPFVWDHGAIRPSAPPRGHACPVLP